jgi:hypothetical protein
MPERFDTRIRTKVSPAKSLLEIQRPTPSTTPTALEPEADRALREQGVALLRRADEERPALLSDFVRKLGLPNAPMHTLSADFSGAGNTVQLGFDFPGEPINAYGVAHIVRASKGEGSFAQLTGPGQSITFTVMWTPMPAGIYLAVVHASGTAQKVGARANVYPSGQFQLIAERTGNKFLIPFELPVSGGLSLNLQIGAGDPGDLMIYRVDMTRVS